MSQPQRRINVTFPTQLLEELDELSPPRQRNHLIVLATREYVRRLKLLKTLRETAGAWDEASHPELATPADIDHWLQQNRAQWRRAALEPEAAHA